MAVDPRKDTGRLAINKANKAAADKAAKAAAQTKQMKALQAAQANNTYKPPTPTSASSVLKAPANNPTPVQTGTNNAFAAVQSAVNAIKNRSTVNSNRASGGGSSSGGGGGSYSGSNARKDTGQVAINNANKTKVLPTPAGKARPALPIKGQAINPQNAIGATAGGKDRIEKAYSGVKRAFTEPVRNDSKQDIINRVKDMGSGYNRNKMYDTNRQIFMETATFIPAGQRLLAGTGDVWDMADVALSAIPGGKIAGAGAKALGKDVLKLADAVKRKIDPRLLDLPIDTFTRRLQPPNQMQQRLIEDTRAGINKTIRATDTAPNFTMKDPPKFPNPNPNKIPNVDGGVGDGLGKVNIGDNARKTLNSDRGKFRSDPGATVRQARPDYTNARKVGPDINDMNRAGDTLRAAGDYAKTHPFKTGLMAAAGGALMSAPAVLDYAKQAFGNSGDPAQNQQFGGFATEEEYEKSLIERAGGVVESDVQRLDEFPTDVAPKDLQTIPNTRQLSGPTNSVGGLPYGGDPTGGGGYSGGGGYNPGFGLQGDRGGNAVEVPYFTYDAEGNMQEHSGYLINGETFTDPNGQYRVPQGAIVMTNNGKDMYQLTPDGSNHLPLMPDGSIDPNSLWWPEMQEHELPPEEMVEEDIIADIMASYEPYLESQFAAIDAQVEQQILQMREQLAARGMYNSDVALSMEQQIREAGAQQKDALYGQVLSQAYGMSLEYMQNQEQLAFENEKFAYGKMTDERDFLEGQRQFAATMGLRYDEMDLSERQLLLEAEYKEKNYQLDAARVRLSGSGGGGGLTAYQQLQMYRDAEEIKYNALDTLMSSAQQDLSGGLSLEQIATRLNARAQTIQGVTPQMITTVMQGVINTSKAGAY